jgi:hypothetical protein
VPWPPSRAWRFHARDGAHGLPWTSAGPWIPWTSAGPWIPWKTAIYLRHGFHGKRQSTGFHGKRQSMGGSESINPGSATESINPGRVRVRPGRAGLGSCQASGRVGLGLTSGRVVVVGSGLVRLRPDIGDARIKRLQTGRNKSRVFEGSGPDDMPKWHALVPPRAGIDCCGRQRPNYK